MPICTKSICECSSKSSFIPPTPDITCLCLFPLWYTEVQNPRVKVEGRAGGHYRLIDTWFLPTIFSTDPSCSGEGAGWLNDGQSFKKYIYWWKYYICPPSPPNLIDLFWPTPTMTGNLKFLAIARKAALFFSQGPSPIILHPSYKLKFQRFVGSQELGFCQYGWTVFIYIIKG